MFPLPMIDNLVARFTPHAISLRDQCTVFAVDVLDHLDRIANAVEDNAAEWDHHILPFALTINNPQAIEVPRGTQWFLQSVAGYPPGVATVLSLRPGAATTNTIPLYTDTFGPAAATKSMNIPIPGGTTLFAVTDQDAILVTFTFRSLRQRPRRTNPSAGWRAQAPDRMDAGQEVGDTQRHVGSWHPGVPVFGPSAPNNNHGASS